MHSAKIVMPSALLVLATAAMGFACTATNEPVEGRTTTVRAGLVPTVSDGNPTCADLGLGAASTKIEPVADGTTTLGTGGTVTVTNANDSTFDFTATAGIDAVIVKGGPNANVYRYDPESMGATGLHAPVNDNNGTFYGLSHIDFCHDADVEVDAGGSTTSSSGSTTSSSSGSTTSSSSGSTTSSSGSTTSSGGTSGGSSGRTW